MISAILFDLDDLMVNSAPLHIEASRQAFLPFGVDVKDMPHEVIASYFGKRISEIIKITAEHFKLSGAIDLDELMERRNAIFLRLIREKLTPMPGLFALLKRVEKLPVKKAVASSGAREYVTTALEKVGASGYFKTVVTGDMVQEGKPSPDIFLRTAKELGVDPEGCLVIEDSETGVLAAKRAGMRCIAVDNQLSPYKQNLSAADVVVKRLDEIGPEMIKKIGEGI